MEATKRCKKCHQEKELAEFHKNSRMHDGHLNACKICQLKATKEYSRTKQGRFTQKRYYNTIRGYLRYVWLNMLFRCNNPKDSNYKYYGGRGIKVKFTSFENFYDYVVNKLNADPRKLTIDRIDNNGNNELGNIRFVTQAENNRNQGL